jgi:predicted Mrr-cat superfamily restriction endonuclease
MPKPSAAPRWSTRVRATCHAPDVPLRMPSRALRVRAWGDPYLEDTMLREQIVVMGGHELDDLLSGPSLEDLRCELLFPDRRHRGIAKFVGYWRQFLYEMQPGDLIAPRITIGCLTTGCDYRTTAPDRIKHVRSAEGLATDLPRDRFDADIKATLDCGGTVRRIRAEGAARRLRSVADAGIDPGADA